MSSRLSLTYLFLLIKLVLPAQDISGIWTGNYEKHAFSSQPEKLVVEIFVYNDSLITGASHLYYKNNLYEHYRINGVIRKTQGVIYFSEDSTIAVKLGFMEENCLGSYTMKLSSTDTLLILNGRWRDNSTSLFRCASSGVWLEKETTAAVKKVIPVKPDKNLGRRSDIQSLIEISHDEKRSITIELYDNGIIDHDSVSLYLDDSLLLYKQIVTGKPIVINISLDKKTSLSKLKLAAESLGSIPPCTVLMFIKTTKKKYEVNLSSNLNSNGVVEFFLKE